MDHFEILGVNISCADRAAILKLPIQWAIEAQARTVFYVNAHCLNLASRDADYRAILNRADLVYPDGISVVWTSRFLGGCPLEKVTGRDWIHDFCDLAVRAGLRLFILAGEPDVAAQSARNLSIRHPGLQIAGVHSGYINAVASADLIAQINQAAPDVLLVGMGTPLQEKWIAQYRHQIEAPVCWAVGALFDYVAGVEPPVPDWMNRLALEWLWRMLIDPLGKWRRYIIGNPLFLLRVLRQKLRTFFAR